MNVKLTKETANKNSVEVLLFIALEYSKENPFSYTDYVDFMDLLTEKTRKSIKQYPQKWYIIKEYDQITATINREFMNIPFYRVKPLVFWACCSCILDSILEPATLIVLASGRFTLNSFSALEAE